MKRAWRLLKYIVREIWKATGQSYDGKIRESDKELHLPNGSEIWLRSAENPDSIKGEGIKGVIIDEFTLMQELIWQECVRPTLLDYGGWAFLMGVPAGQNWGFQLWNKAWQGDMAGWTAYHQSSYDNPYIKKEAIDAVKLDTPELLFRQEYLAEALADGSGVFRNVEACAVAAWQDGPIEGHQYIIGADWGRSNDYTVFVVIDLTMQAVVHIDRSNQVEYTIQRGRLEALWRRFGAIAVIAESNAMGEPIIEVLQRDGVPVQPFQTTNATKQAAIDALALAFERMAIQLPVKDAPFASIMISELNAYSADRLPSGLIRYGAPSGMHDDTVMALALAWQGASQQYEPAFEVSYAEHFGFSDSDY